MIVIGIEDKGGDGGDEEQSKRFTIGTKRSTERKLWLCESLGTKLLF